MITFMRRKDLVTSSSAWLPMDFLTKSDSSEGFITCAVMLFEGF